MADERPVLDAIRALLKFKDYATIAEIAKMSGKTQRQVLDVLNTNGQFVHRYRATGRIARVDPREQLRAKLRKQGHFWWVEEYDYGHTKGLRFENHPELWDEMTKSATGGFIGDSYGYRYVPITDENITKLRAAGMVPFEEVVIDDRLWTE